MALKHLAPPVTSDFSEEIILHNETMATREAWTTSDSWESDRLKLVIFFKNPIYLPAQPFYCLDTNL
jgi:hypothetical protein